MISLLGSIMQNRVAIQAAKAQMEAARRDIGLPPDPRGPSLTDIPASAVSFITRTVLTDALTYAAIIAIGLIYVTLT